MSETEYRTGVLTPTGKTLAEIDPSADSIYDLDEKYVEVMGEIYKVSEEDVDVEDDIYKAEFGWKGTINFTVKYYNGGCDFHEAIKTAIGEL